MFRLALALQNELIALDTDLDILRIDAGKVSFDEQRVVLHTALDSRDESLVGRSRRRPRSAGSLPFADDTVEEVVEFLGGTN